jgi:hypothetical protein
MNCLTQLYNVDAITTDKGNLKFDDKLACQLVVRSSDDGQLLVFRPDNVLDGLCTLRDCLKVGQCVLQSIQYTILGTPDGSQIRTQRYKHDFTTKVLLDGDFNIVPTKGALFIPYQLDVLLDTKNKFPKVTAIQFIA